MGLSFVHFFVGFAGGADAGFELFDEPEDQAFLLEPRPFANRAFETLFGQFAVFFSNRIRLHRKLLSGLDVSGQVLAVLR